MSIYMYVNGGKNIGMGHIMRTLVLAKEFSKDFDVKYFSSFDEEFSSGREKITEFGFDLLDIKNILNYINRDSILIIDNYDIKENDLSFFRDKVKLLCYIDDNGELDYYDVDLIINQNPHGKNISYRVIDSKVLAGGEYTLLRDEFLVYEKIKVAKIVRNILVTVGGSDNLNLTHKILNKIKYLKCKINVVIGNSFIYKNDLINDYKEFSNINFLINPNMSEVMKESDLAIASCGSTLYELSYLGVPTIGLVIVDNQRFLGKYMDEHNIIKLSNFDDLDKDLESISYDDRIAFSENMKSLIDGNGVKRIKKEILKYL